MTVKFIGFSEKDLPMLQRLEKILLSGNASISKYTRNFADIETNDGNITVIKRGICNE